MIILKFSIHLYRQNIKCAGEAERALNINHIRRAIETKGKCGGYHWYAV
jgi:hypothetical protein